MPSKLFEKLIEVIISNPSSSVEISVEILSFSYEVDDALNEPWHKQNLLIDENCSLALISSIDVCNKPEAVKLTEEKNTYIKKFCGFWKNQNDKWLLWLLFGWVIYRVFFK